MKKNIFLTILIFCTMAAAGQNKILISGKVIDNSSRAPLKFAHIGVKDKSFGIVSNENGDFDLYVPEANKNDTLFVSMVGYKRFEALVADILEKSMRSFELESQAILLKEIEITSLSTDKIKSAVNENYSKNYPTAPYQLQAFYREIVKENDSYALLIEAAVAIQDKGFKPVKNRNSVEEDVAIREFRRSFVFMEKAQRRYRANLLAQVLGSNDIRYGFGKNGLFEGFTVARGEDEILDGELIYTLDITTPVGSGKMFVDSETFAVIKVEAVINNKRKLYENDSIVTYQTGIMTTYEYKKYQQKYYLSYGLKNTNYEVFDKLSKTTTFRHTFKSVLTVNEVITNGITPFGKKEIMDNSLPLIYLKKKYNPAFWNEYNLLKQTPVDEKVIGDLEKKMPLSNQFGNNK